MKASTFVAVDIGASGGRVMAGSVDTERVWLDPVHRFSNGVTARNGHLRWDIERLRREVQKGLDLHPRAVSVGIDTWGVDYGLLDTEGNLLADPISYRDERTEMAVDTVHRLISPSELFAINGLQYLPFNTLYQLVAEQRGELWHRAEHALLLPDLLAYWLTGELASEATNASTTGLLDVNTRNWSPDLLDRLGIPRGLLPTVTEPGSVRGTTPSGTAVTTVGSHDTASAVVGVPATSDRFAYIVSGTWSLVGLELASPVLSDAARRANFTNESGVDGRVRFLRNVGGLWLLQECLREWVDTDRRRTTAEMLRDELLSAAGALPRGGPTIDPDDTAFIAPGQMPDRVARAAGRSTMTRAETTRCIIDSLAAAYAQTTHEAARLAGATIDTVHIVGGGSGNDLLCQLTADMTGLPVVAGPVEASALGNLLIQARTHGAAPEQLSDLRALVASSTTLRRFQPS